MSQGNHKSLRSPLCPQSDRGDTKPIVPLDPKDPNDGRAPRGLRDFIGRVVDFPWELEKDIEDNLPTPVEGWLNEFGLAGKPILAALLAAGVVVFATKMSG